MTQLTFFRATNCKIACNLICTVKVIMSLNRLFHPLL